MNKNLFNTKTPTGELAAEYQQYIDDTATTLLRVNGETDLVALETKAQEEVKWSSWVVSVSRRNFAWHCASHAINPDHTIGGIRPTVETATVAISKHIVKRAEELSNKVRPKYFKLRFKIAQRMMNIGDIDPTKDDDRDVSLSNSAAAMKTVHEFYSSYWQIGVDPPVLEVLSFDSDNNIIEEKTVHAPTQEEAAEKHNML